MVLRKIGCDEIIFGLIRILYFDEDQRSFMVIVGFLENIGSVFFYIGDFCISGLTTVQPLCCRIFVKSKGVILIEKCKNFITHVFQI